MRGTKYIKYKLLIVDISQTQIILQLAVALACGSIIGLEREHKKKEAGLQTYSLVTLGSCLFTIIGLQLFNFFADKPNVSFHPMQIILAVATGIGFLGGGVIVHREFRTEGLTTAAGLWMSAAIGVAAGAGLFALAILATIFTILILVVYGEIEQKFLKRD